MLRPLLSVSARAAVLLLVASTPTLAQCNWGSFDASRTHKPGGFLLDTGVYWGMLRNEIAVTGGAVLPGTPTLTGAYLAQCDVFFTSILDDASPPLSSAEQAALSSWLASGGTLVVSGLQIALGFYDSFTAPYGVTGYVGMNGIGTSVTTGASHPLITGVTAFAHNGHCTFSIGANALLLGKDASGGNFMAVLDPSTGFTTGGRIFVFGDAEILDDLEVGNFDHAILLKNVVQWACSGGCLGYFQPYGTGCVGAGGSTPTLTGAGCATPGDSIFISLQNAAPNRPSYTLLGLGQGTAPVNPVCSLQNAPVLPQVVLISTGPAGQWALGTTVPGTVPTPSDAYLHTFIDDPAAPFGASATRPLRIHFE